MLGLKAYQMFRMPSTNIASTFTVRTCAHYVICSFLLRFSWHTGRYGSRRFFSCSRRCRGYSPPRISSRLYSQNPVSETVRHLYCSSAVGSCLASTLGRSETIVLSEDHFTRSCARLRVCPMSHTQLIRCWTRVTNWTRVSWNKADGHANFGSVRSSPFLALESVFTKQLRCLYCCPLDTRGSTTSERGPGIETEEYVVSRKNDNAKHNEGMKHITPELRNNASRANPVDNELHTFVSAKFCHRLQETGLLQHPLVASELSNYEPLYRR